MENINFKLNIKYLYDNNFTHPQIKLKRSELYPVAA